MNTFNLALFISTLAGVSHTRGQEIKPKMKGGCTPGSEAWAASERLATIDEPAIRGMAVGCTDGVASGYPCSNIDLQSFTPLQSLNNGSGSQANDIWGWSKAGKEFAIVGLTTGTSFVDISDPVNPIVLGKLATKTVNSSWRDVKVYNDYALIVSEASGHGMQIFNLNKLLTATPFTTFTEDAHYDQFGNAHNVFVNEESGFAYAVGTSTCSGGLHMVNINTPTNPSNAGCYSARGYTHDVQCVNYDGPDVDYQEKEICFASNEDTVDIIDVTNKANPILISIFEYANDRYTHQGWLTEDKNYFLVDDELDELRGTTDKTRTIIVDVRDLDNPRFVAEYLAASGAIDHNQYVKGNYSYQANYRAGLRILDLSNIASGDLTEAAYFDTYPANDNGSFNSAWSNYPYFESGNVVVSDIEKGLFVVRPNLGSTSPTTPSPTRSPTPSPTISPTTTSQPTSCTSTSCPAGQIELRLVVQTDAYPGENTWSLTDAADTSNVHLTNESPLSPNTEYPKVICLPENVEYAFTITDSWGDGICCEYGSGYYRGFLNGGSEPIFEGSEFGATEVKTFTGSSSPCGDSPTPAPTSLPTSAPTPASTRTPTTSPTVPPTPAPTIPPVSSPTLPPVSLPPSVDPWTIADAEVFTSNNVISVSHDISTGPRDAVVSIYESDCTTPVGAQEIVSVTSGPFTYINDNVTFAITVDGSKLDSSGLVTFNEGTTDAGTISFCTKMSTKTSTDSSAVIVAYKKSKFEVSFDLSEVAFSISNINLIGQTAFEIDLDINFSVSACECDESFICISNTYVQTDTSPEFGVCITPDDSNIEISNLNLKMKGSDGYEYDPVQFGEEATAPNSLSSIRNKPNSNAVRVETRIVDPLFSGSSFTASGTVLLRPAIEGARAKSEFVEYEMTVGVEGAKIEVEEPEGCLQRLKRAFLAP